MERVAEWFHAFFVCISELSTCLYGNRRRTFLNMEQDFDCGFHTYTVTFVYRQETYECSFLSTAELTADSDPLIAWSIADDAIKECMKTIPNKQHGIYPHEIVIRGDFGELKIKD